MSKKPIEFPDLPEGYTWSVDLGADADLVVSVKRPNYDIGDYVVQAALASRVTTPRELQDTVNALAEKVNENVKYIGENK